MNLIRLIFEKPYLYIIIVLIGISLKFYKLDQQFFWDDEICTILHTSGIPMAEYKSSIPVNEVLSKKYFDDLLKLNSRDLKLSDQISGLAKMPQLTPGHYYYLIFFTRIFGDGFMVYRYFSILVFLLSIPFLFLLTKKIFKSELAGWIAISFYTVSPFFQIYAQEARYYPLWAFSLILLNYIFLLALEKEKLKWWIIYAICGAITVQTTVIMYVTVLGHFIYSLLYYRPRLKAILLSQAAIFLSTLPWLVYVHLNMADINQNLSWLHLNSWNQFSLFDLLFRHFNNTIWTFADFGYFGFNNGLRITGTTLTGLFVVIGVTTFFLKATNKPKWFAALIAFLGVFATIALDIIQSTWTYGMPRYSLMSFVGFFVLISYAVQIAIKKRPLLYGICFLLLVSFGIISSFKIANDTAKMAYKRVDTYYYQMDANDRFAGQDRILIITDFNSYPFTAFMSMLHACKNENIDIVYTKPEFPNFKTDYDLSSYDKVYFAYISHDMQKHLKTIFVDNEIAKADKNGRGRGLDTYIFTPQKNQLAEKAKTN